MNKIIVLITIITAISAINQTYLSSQPAPKCQTGFFYRTLPLIANEAYITNLDHLFNGYNLQYQLSGIDDFKQYITLGDKLTLQGKQIPDVPLIGLKNYHIDKKGNTWGSTFIALTERGQRTFVHYGVINSNTSAPVVNNYISVENNTNTTCFDAVLFKAKNIILVDCVVKLKTPNQKGQILQNLFYYFKISDGSFIRTLITEMYVNFRSISRRSMALYSDLFNEHTFLLRTYYSNDIQKPLNENTYIEVFMITEPEDPWIVQIIDRAFLNSKTLSISDVRIYLGEIFILDVKMGVYRVYINTEQDLKFNGYYQVKGFERFSVFSNNLDNHFELALANSHSALQIDWTNKLQPRLINKYSLMPDSIVSQIFLNERFVFIQSQSQFNDITYNYTWIMNRGDRTYTKAFKVIKHNSAKTIIDLNQDMSFLIIIDDQKLVNYKLDDSNMVIKIKKDEDLLDKINSFQISAISKDEMDSSVKECKILINFTLLQDNNRTMWPIGQAPPSKFTANYPGKVLIKLHEYVLGPNITYQIKQVDHDVIKKLKVYQQQQIKVIWQSEPPFYINASTVIKFLLTQTINYQSLTHDLMHLYLQDDKNITYYVTCLPQHTLQEVKCNFTHKEQFEGEIINWASGFFLNSYTFKQNHVIAFSTKKHYNKVSMIDFTQKQTLSDIDLQKGFAGNTTSIAITNKQLYVVLKYVKNVQIYDLQLCLEGICQPKCQLNYLKMYQMGIKYFSPTEVYTSIYHKNIIFIKTSDQIIVVDYNSQCQPKYLATVLPVQTAEIQFSFKINQKYLIVAIPTLNTIKEFNIQRLQLGDVRLTKQYPRYGHSLPKSYDLDISDKGDCIYATMINQGGDHQIFVYRSGFPAVGALYDVIDLMSFDNILVDTTGYQIDYLSVYSSKELRIFRQYEKPLAEIFNPNVSYSFYLDYSNPSSKSNLQLIDVKIVNLPTYIKVNPDLDDIMNTKDLLFSGTNRVNEVNDSKWWQGNVVTVEGDCSDCRGDNAIIKVNNHIQHKEQQTLVPLMSEYAWSNRGGSIQSINSVINMRHNGTVNHFVKLPFRENQLCLTLTVGPRSEYQVSGCITIKSINLYLTTFISEKGFAHQAFQTAALEMFKLEAVNDLIILVDASNDPYKKNRPGGIYLYTINFDEQIPTSFIQVEYIDGEDVGMDELGDLYINNAELTYHAQTDTYRLYFTEITRGVFVIDFQYAAKTTSITIRAINFLKLQPLLSPLGYQLPYDASYQALKLISKKYDQTLKKTSDTILLTTGKFHIIELKIEYTLTGDIIQQSISRLYMRYAFYDIQNYIKYHNGLFVVSQILPQEFDIQNRSKQLLTIYSTLDNRSFTIAPASIKDDKIQERGFLGGFRIDDTILHNFDFNLTAAEEDGHSVPRLGMVLIENFSNKLQKFTLHQNLSVVTKQMVDTQIIYIDLKNDFSLQKIRILINGYSPFPEWKLITIILFSIIGGILLILGILIGVRKIRARYGVGGGFDEEGEHKESMLTTSDRKSFEPLSLRDSEDRTSAYEDKKKKKQMQKQQKRLQKQEREKSKQRQKQQRQREKERQKQQKERQKNEKVRQRQAERQRKRQQSQNRQYQRESDRTRQKQRQKQREQQRQRQRQRQKEKEKQSQRSRQNSLSLKNQSLSPSNLQNQNNYASYEENRSSRADLDEDNPFARRPTFRERTDRSTRNYQNFVRPPPSNVIRNRRNNAIIEQ